jgi:hypothetical protein
LNIELWLDQRGIIFAGDGISFSGNLVSLPYSLGYSRNRNSLCRRTGGGDPGASGRRAEPPGHFGRHSRRNWGVATARSPSQPPSQAKLQPPTICFRLRRLALLASDMNRDKTRDNRMRACCRSKPFIEIPKSRVIGIDLVRSKRRVNRMAVISGFSGQWGNYTLSFPFGVKTFVPRATEFLLGLAEKKQPSGTQLLIFLVFPSPP